MRLFGCLLVLLLLPGGSWAACTAATLATELTTDPASLGYAPYIAAGNDAALWSLVTTVREGEAYLVSKGQVSMESAMGTWGDVILLIPSHPTAAVADRWGKAVDRLFIPRTTIDYADASTAAFFTAMVADQLRKGDGSELLTLDDVTTRTTRQGSRAEVLCGTKASDRVTLAAISCALRSQGCS